MAKVFKHTNHRVEVTPVTWRYREGSHEAMKKECRSLVEQITRHVDGYGSIDIEWDTETVCSFCGYDWEAGQGEEPQCCTKAQDEWAVEVLERSQKP